MAREIAIPQPKLFPADEYFCRLIVFGGKDRGEAAALAYRTRDAAHAKNRGALKFRKFEIKRRVIELWRERQDMLATNAGWDAVRMVREADGVFHAAMAEKDYANALKAMERIERVLGLGAPEKLEASLGIRVNVIHFDQVPEAAKAVQKPQAVLRLVKPA